MIAIVTASNMSMFHRHKWIIVKVIGSAEYFKCKCGAKKVVYPPLDGKNIRWGWMSGVNKTLKQSPTKKGEVNA